MGNFQPFRANVLLSSRLFCNHRAYFVMSADIYHNQLYIHQHPQHAQNSQPLEQKKKINKIRLLTNINLMHWRQSFSSTSNMISSICPTLIDGLNARAVVQK